MYKRYKRQLNIDDCSCDPMHEECRVYSRSFKVILPGHNNCMCHRSRGETIQLFVPIIYGGNWDVDEMNTYYIENVWHDIDNYFREHGMTQVVRRCERDLGESWVVELLQELLSNEDRSFLAQSCRSLHQSIPFSDEEESEESLPSLGIDYSPCSDFSDGLLMGLSGPDQSEFEEESSD